MKTIRFTTKIFEIIGLVILFITSSTIAQSHAEYYPLQIGNKWFYRTSTDVIAPIATPPLISYYSKEIVGDTILDNGNKYYIVFESGGMHYERFDSLTNEIRYYSNSNIQGKETSMYSLNYSKDSIVTWKSLNSWTYKISFVQQDMSDTSFIKLIGIGPIDISVSFKKYIGIDYHSSWEIGGSYSSLIGYRIDGKEWGQLTSVNINNNINPEYRLEQNYPNPFNPNTTIVFEIPVSSHVKIIVYNSLGETVRILQNKYLSPGSYKLNFNAGNLASGVYYYQLISEGKIFTKKLLLIK
jgi:hypothetical protein